MKQKKLCLQSLLGALFLSICTVIGAIYGPMGTEMGTMGTRQQRLLYVPMVILLAVLLYLPLKKILNRPFHAPETVRQGRISTLFEKHLFLSAFLLILLAWIPFILVFLPGSVPYDGYFQLNMATGISPMTNHHPVLATLIIGFFFSLGQHISDNFGVFCYILFQTLVCAAVFALCVKKIYAFQRSLKACAWAIVFFAVVPVWGLHVQAMVKDTLFFALFLLYTLSFLEIADACLVKKQAVIPVRRWILLVACGAMICLTRHGEIYVVAFSLLLLLLFSLHHKKQAAAALLATVILAVGVNAQLVRVTQAGYYPTRAIFSIPFQQTARYLKEYPDDATKEEREAINAVLSVSTIAERFSPLVSDPVKNTYRSTTTKEDLVRYLQVWFHMFFRHPRVYADAFLQHASGFFNPFHHASPLVDFQTYIKGEPIATGDLDIHYLTSGRVRSLMAFYQNLWLTTPGLEQLCYPGTYTWAVAVCFLLVWKKKRYRQLIVFSIPVMKILICVASPLSGSIRYTLPVMAIMPLLIAWTVKEARIADGAQEAPESEDGLLTEGDGEGRRKIGVITFFNYCNFGAALQCYGLSETLQKLGHEVEYIDYTCPFIGHPFGWNSLKKRGLFGYIYTVAGNLFYLPRHGLFRAFRELIPHSDPVTPKNIDQYADCYDRYITGSDQVWSTKLTDFDKNYFLAFVKDPAKKFSYSASFGGSSINESRREEYTQLLSDFNAISVREDYGSQIVRELTGKAADIVLDPTLLLRREDWEKAASPKRRKKPYLLVYQLGFSGSLVKAVKQLKKEKALPVAYIPFPLGGAVAGRYQLRLGPREWLAQFRDAEYIVTDSYHGIIFSILFEKKFVVVANGQHKNQRVISLLTRLGLTDRILDASMPDIDAEIDYEHVKELLEADRQRSIAWLKDHI